VISAVSPASENGVSIKNQSDKSHRALPVDDRLKVLSR
jgi:hypothetical protein